MLIHMLTAGCTNSRCINSTRFKHQTCNDINANPVLNQDNLKQHLPLPQYTRDASFSQTNCNLLQQVSNFRQQNAISHYGNPDFIIIKFTEKKYNEKRKTKKRETDRSGIRTHDLQIRSLTRYPLRYAINCDFYSCCFIY